MDADAKNTNHTARDGYRDAVASGDVVTALYELLAENARALWGRCLVGNPAPNTLRIYQAMRSPAPGDLVMEISAPWLMGLSRQAIGVMERVEVEPIREPTDAEPDPPRDTFVYIRTLDGQSVRWENYRFIRIFRPGEHIEIERT